MVTTICDNAPNELPPKQHRTTTMLSPPLNKNIENKSEIHLSVTQIKNTLIATPRGSSWKHWNDNNCDVTFGIEIPLSESASRQKSTSVSNTNVSIPSSNHHASSKEITNTTNSKRMHNSIVFTSMIENKPSDVNQSSTTEYIPVSLYRYATPIDSNNDDRSAAPLFYTTTNDIHDIRHKKTYHNMECTEK